eukprot:Tbor_TRINITY_DN5630_c4_g7::TRINITY_DN5630_c4_g7_i1::g.8414::m.8414/K11600/RRP41, EXOSC4, SKI6; exosome complex component RRP41
MSRNIEYINAANLRLDGRRTHESRKVTVELGAFSDSDGSCIYTCGGTKVAALVYGPSQSHYNNNISGEGSVTCSVAMLAFSGERRRDTKRRSKPARELSKCIERIVRSVIITSMYPSSNIQIYVEVLHQEGGEKAACINAVFMALNDASIAMSDTVVGITAGIIDNKVLLDCSQRELRSECPHLTIAVRAHTPRDSIVYMEMDSRVSEEVLESMVVSGASGCGELYSVYLEPVLRSNVTKSCEAKYIK